LEKTNLTRVLIVEDNPGDADILRKLFSELKYNPANLIFADRLSAGLKCAERKDIDIIILDLRLPDSHGLDTLIRVQGVNPYVPIIILTGINDEGTAIEAIHSGAQDYLVKGQIDSQLLSHSIKYSLLRHKVVREIKESSLTDELTGLYTRKGFISFARQQLKIAVRSKGDILLFFIDFDGLKQINDTFGHQEGDNAIKEAARILKETFRDSDIIARFGGDEFAVLVINTLKGSEDVLKNRLKENIEIHNNLKDRKYTISLSSGIARYNATPPDTLDELISKADALMYEHKRKKNRD